MNNNNVQSHPWELKLIQIDMKLRNSYNTLNCVMRQSIHDGLAALYKLGYFRDDAVDNDLDQEHYFQRYVISDDLIGRYCFWRLIATFILHSLVPPYSLEESNADKSSEDDRSNSGATLDDESTDSGTAWENDSSDSDSASRHKGSFGDVAEDSDGRLSPGPNANLHK